MLINLEQQSQEWLDWRKNGIGASDIGKLLGAYFFCYHSVTDLWKEKVGLSAPFVVNDAVQKGMDYEEEARNFYIQVTGNKVTPKCFQHDEYLFLRVSMDGITEDNKIALEIKVPQEKGFLKAKKGTVKDYYYSQMQLQLLVTGAEYCHYWVYNPDEGACLFKINRNEEYMSEIILRASKFWNEFVIPKKCPVSSDFGMNDKKQFDPFIAGNMKSEFVNFYPIISNMDLF